MKVYISAGRACGEVKAPPSKSMTHRALICAALVGVKACSKADSKADLKDGLNPELKDGLKAESKDDLKAHAKLWLKSDDDLCEISHDKNCVRDGYGCAPKAVLIKNVQLSEDIKATIACLEAMGAVIERRDDCLLVSSIARELHCEKASRQSHVPELFCGESGSTLRFLMPLALALGKSVVFKGTKRLMERPLDSYEEICGERGILLERTASEDGVHGLLTVNGGLQGGDFFVRGDVSSQFATGLLLTLPLLEEDSRLVFTTELVSRPYVDMTLDVMAEFGVNASFSEDGREIFIKGNQSYTMPRHHCADEEETPFYEVEGDYSNAAFFDALNYIGPKRNRGKVRVTSLKKDSLQGDKAYFEYFALLEKGHATIEITDCPDLCPVLMVVAAANHGGRFTGTDRLSFKESDRGRAMISELKKMGIKTKFGNDYIDVFGGDIYEPAEVIDSHNDHRIAMAMSILCTLTGGTVNGSASVKKSFPDFYRKLSDLGIDVSYREIV